MAHALDWLWLHFHPLVVSHFVEPSECKLAWLAKHHHKLEAFAHCTANGQSIFASHDIERCDYLQTALRSSSESLSVPNVWLDPLGFSALAETPTFGLKILTQTFSWATSGRAMVLATVDCSDLV